MHIAHIWIEMKEQLVRTDGDIGAFVTTSDIATLEGYLMQVGLGLADA